MTTTVRFAEWELKILKEAIRIGLEDESLTNFADAKDIEKLSRKIERAHKRAS